jgi:hypothetical protein
MRPNIGQTDRANRKWQPLQLGTFLLNRESKNRLQLQVETFLPDTSHN